MPDEDAKVREFASERNLDIISVIPRSDDINVAAAQGKTVIEMDPSSSISRRFIELARTLAE